MPLHVLARSPPVVEASLPPVHPIGLDEAFALTLDQLQLDRGMQPANPSSTGLVEESSVIWVVDILQLFVAK